MEQRKWRYIGLVLLAGCVGVISVRSVLQRSTSQISAPLNGSPAPAVATQGNEFNEPPETAKTRRVSEQRLAFARAMANVTPDHGIGYSTPCYFEIGGADERFIIWDAAEGTGRPNKDTCLIAQSFDGKTGRTLFKQRLQILGTGNASVPHLGTLARIIFSDGFEVAKPCPPDVAAYLDKAVPYAGYRPSMPGDTLSAWVVEPNGE